ncbi:MAG: DEAD/DEAH box helicase [Bacteroidota bacterium]
METTKLTDTIKNTLDTITSDHTLAINFSKGQECFHKDKCLVLYCSSSKFGVLVEEPDRDTVIELHNDNDDNLVLPYNYRSESGWRSAEIAALLCLYDQVSNTGAGSFPDHRKYTREGMIHRVLAERSLKASKAEFRIEWADNIYGDHWVYNQKGERYRVFLRDFESETGYSNSPDARTNKLGTTKHIIAAFHQLKRDEALMNRLSKKFPFVEIYLDPRNEYRVSWAYPEQLPEEVSSLINDFFNEEKFIKDEYLKDFLPFLDQAQVYDMVKIRPEVIEKVDSAYEEEMLNWVRQNYQIPYDQIKADMYPYQQKGVEAITYKKGMILADEMGLGKTLQAIAASVAKKHIFGFKKTLIICPASLKEQWKKEIERFTNEQAHIVQGGPKERLKQYLTSEAYFLILNYELVLRDTVSINKAGIDFLVLDEAQRAKNFETKTANAIKRIEKKHCLILTGTPIENKLSDLYSLMQIIDEHFLGPLWEFSYQHCFFDHENINKINGYYNLENLKKRLKPVLLRREKKKVIKELPNINQVDVMVELGLLQADYHAGYASGLHRILKKKFLTPADHTRIHQLLTGMRMVCNSTFLVDNETNESTKMMELEHILLEKLDILHADHKIIIFSEWIKTHKLIGELLRKYDLQYIEFNGTVPVAKRGKLIETFENNPQCKFFLSTESGGAGLNLQVADTLINFELPWNPAKKNQRIGRIDRLGQQKMHLTVINLITKNSIEMRIASGLMLKQNLFEGVLNDTVNTDAVDFSEKGRSQFLSDLEEMVSGFDTSDELHEVAEQVEDEDSELLTTELLSDNEPAIINDTVKKSSGAKTDTQPLEISEKPVQTEQLEGVLQKGMGFFSGLYQIATGQEMGAEEQQINIDKDTGEVTMKFKLPGFGK